MIKDFDIPVFGNKSELVSFLDCDKPTLVKIESYKDFINDRDVVLRKLKEEGKHYIVTNSVTHLKYGILEKNASNFEVYSAPEPQPFTADIVSIESSNVGYIQFKIVNKYRNMFNNENFKRMVKLIDSKNKHFNLYREVLNTVETSNDGLYVNVSFKVYGDAVLAANIKNIDTLEFDFKCTLNKMEAKFTKNEDAEADYLNKYDVANFETMLKARDMTELLEEFIGMLKKFNIDKIFTRLSESPKELNDFTILFNRLLDIESNNLGFRAKYDLKNRIQPGFVMVDILKEFIKILVSSYINTKIVTDSIDFTTKTFLKLFISVEDGKLNIKSNDNFSLDKINTFNHRQLGKTDKWLKDKIKTSSEDGHINYINMWNFDANDFDTILDTTKDLKDLLTMLMNYDLEGLLTKLSNDSDKLNNFTDLFNKLLLQELDNIGLHTSDKLKNEVMPKLKTFDALKEFLPLLVGNFRCTGVLPYSLVFAIDTYLKSLSVTIKNGIPYIENKEVNESIDKLKEHDEVLEEFYVGDEPNFTDIIKLKRKYHNTSTDLVTELSKKTNAVNVFIFKLQYVLRKECSRYNDTKTVKLVEELEKHIIPRLSDLDILRKFLDLLDVNHGDNIFNPLNDIECISYAIIETMNSLKDKGIVK